MHSKLSSAAVVDKEKDIIRKIMRVMYSTHFELYSFYYSISCFYKAIAIILKKIILYYGSNFEKSVLSSSAIIVLYDSKFPEPPFRQKVTLMAEACLFTLMIFLATDDQWTYCFE